MVAFFFALPGLLPIMPAVIIVRDKANRNGSIMNDDFLFPEDRREETSDRRNDQSEIPQERRMGNERRRLIYGVQFTTGGSLQSLKDWLDENCRGEYSVVLTDMDDDLIKKTVRIMFELPQDKEVFKASAGQI